jgi:hypothetical protein
MRSEKTMQNKSLKKGPANDQFCSTRLHASACFVSGIREAGVCFISDGSWHIFLIFPAEFGIKLRALRLN